MKFKRFVRRQADRIRVLLGRSVRPSFKQWYATGFVPIGGAMPVAGMRTTGNIAASQRAIDMAKEILVLEPEATPLCVITKQGKFSNRRAVDPKVRWHEAESHDRFDAINNGAGYSNSATSIVVDDGTLFRAEDLVLVPRTKEIISVDSISTNTLTATRGFGDADAAALLDNDVLIIIGNASEEGDTSVAARTNNPTEKFNFVQLLKRSVEASGTELSSDNLSSPHDWRHQQQMEGIEHLKSIEYACLFGRRADTTGADGKPRRAMNGLDAYLTENVQDAGGTLTELELEAWFRSLFRYGSKKKVAFVSRVVMSAINVFAQGKLETVVGAETYGVKVRNLVTGQGGELGLIVHDLLEGDVFGGYAYGVDVKTLRWAYLHGLDAPGGSRDTKLHEDVQANDLDGRKDEWRTEGCIYVEQPKKSGVLKGVTV